MKKTWPWVVACILFIIAYDQLVLRPYYKKSQPQPTVEVSANPKAPTSSESLSAGPESVQNKESMAAVAGNQVLPWSPAQKINLSQQTVPQSIRLEFSPQRSIRVLSDGTLLMAELQEYHPRGKTADTLKLAERGLRWISSNALVEQCLRSMKASPGLDPVSLVGTVPGLRCALEYQKTNIPGQILIKATLHSTAGVLPGELRLVGQDNVGNVPKADQNFVKYRLDASNERIVDFSQERLVSGQTPLEWLVWGDRYFATAFVPMGQYAPNVILRPVSQEVGGVEFGVSYPLDKISASTEPIQLTTYVGTRERDVFFSIKPSMADAVELGFFAAVARGLLWLLNQINKVVSNYGVSIVILTLLVRAVFWPLNKKVYVSGQKMKLLAPEMEKIKNKYGTDKEKAQQMNLEIMGLYKKHKVNPLGSCLPLLLQMPIFIGLYSALNHSIDLYQAHFFGWIVDLSARDPFFVFPVLWTISLLAYMWINPTMTQSQPGMPDMKWIFVAMNIFFGWMSKDWPAGLTLYLFVSNLVGIIQQLVMQRVVKLQPLQEGA